MKQPPPLQGDGGREECRCGWWDEVIHRERQVAECQLYEACSDAFMLIGSATHDSFHSLCKRTRGHKCWHLRCVQAV